MKLLAPKFWLKNEVSIYSILLFPISFIIQVLINIKKYFSLNKNFETPIICVGNIFLGGTGKTPLSIKLCELISKKFKRKTCIVRKYYKNHQDEFSLIKKSVKNFFTGRSRIVAIEKARNKNNEIIILDDGFQDYSIKKRLNIICFNSDQLDGNGFTIPSGPLRESLNSLKRCHLVLINGEKRPKFEKKIKKINKNIQFFYSYYEIKKISSFRKKNFFAFAGIGNPQNFFKLLKKKRLNIKKTLAFPDHYNYTEQDLVKLRNESKKNNLTLLTTQKDFFRNKHLKNMKIDYVEIILKIKKENDFLKLVKRHI